MKNFSLAILFAFNFLAAFSQDTIQLKDLAVPNSPAFVLTDATPSLIQSPTTPKTFVLGIAQSFQQSSGGFPQNYSAEFAPYWLMGSLKRDVYSLLGLKTKRDANNSIISVDGEDPFSGLKFTSVSIAFLNKDLIPDTASVSHKIISLGLHSTIVKIHLRNYAEDLNKKLKLWHETAQLEIDTALIVELEIAKSLNDTAKIKKINDKIIAKLKLSKATPITKEINALMEQKPIFAWDIATAYASYGINDSVWKPGRFGIWTTVSSNLPLDLGGEKSVKNYLSLNFSLRYLHDNYQKDAKGGISKMNNIDVGGKIALEFDKISVGIESLNRYINGVANSQNRTVGIISYKLTENIYLNGAFGKNFDSPNWLISQFGLNWGFGSEKAKLPVQ